MAFTPVPVPDPDSTNNDTSSDVTGNKLDAPSSDPLASLMARIKAIGVILGTTSWQLEVHSECPEVAQEGETIQFNCTLKNRNTGQPIPVGDITAGTLDVIRIRGGTPTTILTGVSFSKVNGLVYYKLTLDSTNWQDNDTFLFFPNTDTTVTIGTDVLTAVITPQSGIVTDLGGIPTKIDTLLQATENVQPTDTWGTVRVPPGASRINSRYVAYDAAGGGDGLSWGTAWTTLEFLNAIASLPDWTVVYFKGDRFYQAVYDFGAGGDVKGAYITDKAKLWLVGEPYAPVLATGFRNPIDSALSTNFINSVASSTIVTIEGSTVFLGGVNINGAGGLGSSADRGVYAKALTGVRNSFVQGQSLTLTNFPVLGWENEHAETRLERSLVGQNALDIKATHAAGNLFMKDMLIGYGLGTKSLDIQNTNFLSVERTTFFNNFGPYTAIDIGGGLLGFFKDNTFDDTISVAYNGLSNFTFLDFHNSDSEKSWTTYSGLIDAVGLAWTIDPAIVGINKGTCDIAVDLNPIQSGDSFEIKVLINTPWGYRDYTKKIISGVQPVKVLHIHDVPVSYAYDARIQITKKIGTDRTFNWGFRCRRVD